MGPSVSNSLTDSLFVDLTDVSLIDEDTNSILAHDTNRAIPGNVAMQVLPFSGLIWNQCKSRHFVTKFATNTSGTTLWVNL